MKGALNMIMWFFGLHTLALLAVVAYFFSTGYLTKEKLTLVKDSFDGKLVTKDESAWWHSFIPKDADVDEYERNLIQATKKIRADFQAQQDRLDLAWREVASQKQNAQEMIEKFKDENVEMQKSIRAFWKDYEELRNHLRSTAFNEQVGRLMKLTPTEIFEILKLNPDDREVALIIRAMKKEKTEAAVLSAFMTSQEADPLIKAPSYAEGWQAPRVSERGKKIEELLRTGDLKIPPAANIPDLQKLDEMLQRNEWLKKKFDESNTKTGGTAQ